MHFKKISLILNDCYAAIDLSSGEDDMVTLSITELEVDQEKSTVDVTHHKPVSTTEIYLGVEETKTLIESLNYVLPKE